MIASHRLLPLLTAATFLGTSPVHSDQNEQSMTVELIAAAEVGDTSRLREILTAHPKLVNAAGSNGNPVLFAAAGKSQLEAVRLLLELGADLGAENGGGARVLHHCAWMGPTLPCSIC